MKYRKLMTSLGFVVICSIVSPVILAAGDEPDLTIYPISFTNHVGAEVTVKTDVSLGIFINTSTNDVYAGCGGVISTSAYTIESSTTSAWDAKTSKDCGDGVSAYGRFTIQQKVDNNTYITVCDGEYQYPDEGLSIQTNYPGYQCSVNNGTEVTIGTPDEGSK